MGTSSAPSAASQYGAANAAIQGNAANAVGMAANTPPVTYQPNYSDLNTTAGLLSRAKVLNDNQALSQAYGPAVLQGKNQAVTDLTGGVAGDDAFLRNAALKSGLEQGATQGTVGAGSVVNPTSAGGVTAEKIYGSQLLNYRNARDQQALGVASAVTPDASIDPSTGVGLQVQQGQQQAQNTNDWNAFLSNMRLGQVQNLQNQTQQQEAATQGVYNANSQAKNANQSAEIAGGAALAAAAIGAVVL
jgi:hypothetical protein